MGLKVVDKPHWVGHFNLPDNNHNIGDGEWVKFLEKEPYNEELRYNQEYHTDNMFTEKPSFKLFFRPLRATDKEMYLGYKYPK